MSYKFNDTFILRFEFFGGLVISNKTFEIYTIGFEDAIFLDCIKNNLSVKDSIYVVALVLNVDYSPNIDEMCEIGLLKKNLIAEDKQKRLTEKTILYYKAKIKEIRKTNYLSAPIEVSIYPSSFCQLNCTFCYFKAKRGEYKEVLSIEKWLKIIDQIKKLNVVYLSILGGEPTLYKDIDKLLEYINDIKLKTTITTNGVNIKNSTCNIICNSNYITPAVSLQAVNDSNLDLMGVNYKTIVKTIDKFLDRGIKPRINTVVSTQTIDDIYQMIDFCVGRNIEEYYLNAYMPVDGDSNYCHSFHYYKKIDSLVKKYIVDNNYQGRINVAMQGCLLYSAYYNELENPVSNEYERLIYGCEAGNIKMEIMPNGDVLPCAAFTLGDFKYENVFDKSLSEIWNTAYYLTELRNYKVKDARCRKCKYYDFCNGGCPAYNLYKNKNILEKGDDRCLVEI